MKLKLTIIGVFVMSLLVWQSAAFAEMVQGQVTQVSPDNQTLIVQRIAPDGKQEDIKLSVDENAQLRGIQSLNELSVGDEIRAEANRPTMGLGSWNAQWVERSGAGAQQGQGTPGGQL